MTSDDFGLLIGIDVSKNELVICTSPEAPVITLSNTAEAIAAWLATLPEGRHAFAIEPTNTFHVTLSLQAHAAGHAVFMIDGLRLSRYRDSIGTRAKTDTLDAVLLRRYLSREMEDLRLWTPPPAGFVAVQSLLRRRATLVQNLAAVRQSLEGLDAVAEAFEQAQAGFDKLLKRLDQAITAEIQRHGWEPDRARCLAIEGVGPLTSAAVVTAYRRGEFSSSDAFVAYAGMDVRVRDSGQARGRRKLTKQGDSELRRLLYCAAMAARRSATWAPFYTACIDRGMATTQALVALARKLLRVMFALLKHQTEYQPKPINSPA